MSSPLIGLNEIHCLDTFTSGHLKSHVLVCLVETKKCLAEIDILLEPKKMNKSCFSVNKRGTIHEYFITSSPVRVHIVCFQK